MAEEKKDPCAGLKGAALLNCQDNEALAVERVKKYQAKQRLIASEPPARVTTTTPAAPPSPASARDEQDILDVLSPMAKKRLRDQNK